MKNLLLPLLFIFLTTSAGFAQTEGKRPPTKPKHYFVHNSESSRGKNAKVKFRKVNNIHPIVDLNPKSQEKFKTAKAPKNWKWSNGY